MLACLSHLSPVYYKTTCFIIYAYIWPEREPPWYMRAINFGRYNLNHNLSSHFIPPATRNLVNKKQQK